MGFSREDFDKVEVSKVTEFLQSCARKRTTIHYDDAFKEASKWGMFHGPHDKRLWDLLGVISEMEVETGRAALSAIVVIKSGDGAGLPGTGFFELEKDLGRYRGDAETTWVAEVNALFDYWPSN